MKFYYEEKTYDVNVFNVFDCATKDDYIDLVEALAVCLDIPSLSEIGISAMIVFDDIKDDVFVELVIDGDDIVSIEEDEIELTKEERDLIVEKLSVAAE